MERFLSVKEGTLEHAVFKTLGVVDFDSPVNHTTVHPAVWSALNNGHPDVSSYKYAGTPITRMNHDLLKLPSEVFEDGRREDLEKIVGAIKQTREVKAYLTQNPGEKERLDEVIAHALDLFRVKSPYYWRDSTTADPTYHKSIYLEAQNLPLEMNRHNARQLAAFAHEKLSGGQKEFTIMDVGTGGGNTIRFALEEIRALDPEHLGKVNVVLNDIETSVSDVGKKLKADFGVKSVTVVPTTFYALPQTLGLKGMFPAWKMAADGDYEKIARLKGKVDAFTSFASLNNIPHSGLAFQTISALLRKGGRAFVGDWSGYDTTQRKFTQKQLDRKIPVDGGVTVRKNIKGFWWFWLHHHGYIDLPTRQAKQLKWWDKLENYIDTSPQVDVLDWFNKNHPKMEAERIKRRRKFTFFGYANRAYRTPEMVRDAAANAGLVERYLGYPMAGKKQTEDGKITFEPHNPRFVTWSGIFEKN